MTEPACQCGFQPDLRLTPSFCSACGSPLLLTAPEVLERLPELTAIHAAILACVANLTSVEIAQVEGEHAWTRVDPAGFSVVAWFRRNEVRSGVHAIETNPLRSGGLMLTSTADKEPGRRVKIQSIDELPGILPSLLDD